MSNYYTLSVLGCFCIASYLCANAVLICKWHFNGMAATSDQFSKHCEKKN